jgi:DNA-binding XRE family transcriptional regulator
MQALSVQEFAARVRAARGYAGLTQAQLGERLGHVAKTIERLEAGHRERLDLHEQRQLGHDIAQACGLHREWLFTAFTAPMLGRLSDLENRLDGIEGRLADLDGG